MSWDLDNIGNKLSNLTVYDVKSLYRQARNYALNVSEIEAKVDEATNSDPWGASTTLMWEIAQATHNYADFGEIMQAIFRRFMEKEAHEWREIYKALQLLEYLVKNGAERVVDDARMHVSTIKILRNFYYVEPETSKDVGVNVRTRAGELADLLGDVDRIRAERRKARANRAKFATGGGAGDFAPGSGTGRFGGFSSDQYFESGGFSGPSAAASGLGDTRSSSYRASYDEYDAGADERPTPRPAGRAPPRQSSSPVASKTTPHAPTRAPGPAPVADLLNWDDSDDDKPLRPATGATSSAPSAAVPAPAVTPAVPAGNSKSKAVDPLDDFGDFADFSKPAPPPAAPALAPAAKPLPSPSVVSAGPPSQAGSSVPAQAQAKAPAPAPSQPTKANAAMFDFLAPSQSGGRTTGPGTVRAGSFASSTSSLSGAGTPAKPSTPSGQPGSSTNFDDLWASAGPRTTTSSKAPKTMAELAATKSSDAVWGSGTPAPQTSNKPKDVFDLL